MKKNTAVTVTATTATNTPPKFFAPLDTGKTKAQLWIRSGTVTTITRLAKSATVYVRQRKKRLSQRKVKVNNWNPV